MRISGLPASFFCIGLIIIAAFVIAKDRQQTAIEKDGSLAYVSAKCGIEPTDEMATTAMSKIKRCLQDKYIEGSIDGYQAGLSWGKQLQKTDDNKKKVKKVTAVYKPDAQTIYFVRYINNECGFSRAMTIGETYKGIANCISYRNEIVLNFKKAYKIGL